MPRRLPEQQPASGDTERSKNSQQTGPTGSDPGEAGREKDPARGEESEILGTWYPDKKCLEIKTYEQVLPPESVSVVMIELPKGQIYMEQMEYSNQN